MIVIATKDELELAQKYNKNNEEIIITGVGGLNVIEKLKDIDKSTEILNIGYVGSNKIKKGTEVTVSESSLYHPNVEYIEPTYKLSGTTKCLTSNDFVLETSITEEVIFDMELAYILALGFTNVKSIKIVSDNLSYEEYENSIN